MQLYIYSQALSSLQKLVELPYLIHVRLYTLWFRTAKAGNILTFCYVHRFIRTVGLTTSQQGIKLKIPTCEIT